MRYCSTRDSSRLVGFSQALSEGLARDGGLYVPARWPALDWEGRSQGPVDPGDPAALARIGAWFLAPFLDDDPLSDALEAIAQEAFDFPAPLVTLDETARLSTLELFHGPTAAFKDFGARFLAAALARLPRSGQRPLKILVATSGDTGGAVAAAFHGRLNMEVALLYPEGRVSPTQERQLTCWDGNVRSFSVDGSFDDCQRLVKQALVDPRLRGRCELSSANSINLGRLLPQCVYYAATSLAVRHRYGEPACFVIPSGNLGNAMACVWARRLGAPIGSIVLAHNANRTVPDYLEEGTLRVRPSVATLASAMDVGNPSNLERLQALHPGAAGLRAAVSAVSIDDEAIRARIRIDYQRYGRVWCPHSSTAAEAYARLSPTVRLQRPWVLVATAHPAKFREIVEPLIGARVPLPESLARLFERPSRVQRIGADFESLVRQL